MHFVYMGCKLLLRYFRLIVVLWALSERERERESLCVIVENNISLTDHNDKGDWRGYHHSGRSRSVIV